MWNPNPPQDSGLDLGTKFAMQGPCRAWFQDKKYILLLFSSVGIEALHYVSRWSQGVLFRTVNVALVPLYLSLYGILLIVMCIFLYCLTMIVVNLKNEKSISYVRWSHIRQQKKLWNQGPQIQKNIVSFCFSFYRINYWLDLIFNTCLQRCSQLLCNDATYSKKFCKMYFVFQTRQNV